MPSSEHHVAVLDKGGLLHSAQELALKEYFTLTLVHQVGESLLMDFKNHPVDIFLLVLEVAKEGESLLALRAIKQLYPEIPLLIATAISMEEVDRLIPYSLMGVLPLDWHLERLLEMLKAHEAVIKVYAKKVRQRWENRQAAVSIEESIERFFSITQERLGAFECDSKRSKRLNYAIMKRFIHTAHNNFIELDPGLQANRPLLEAKERLDEALRLQMLLKRRLDASIERSYEEIFLKNQPLYQEIISQLEQTRYKIGICHQERGILTMQINAVRAEKRHKENKERQEELEATFKRLNRRYVDRVHELNELQKEYDRLQEQRQELWDRDFGEFVPIFKREAGKYERAYEALVDKLAYRFDRFLWIGARESKMVREHFARGMIEGVFSSKTYLEYYVNQLDGKVASSLNKQMIRYRHIMEEENAIHVALLGNVREDLIQIKAQLEGVDSYIHVEVYQPETLERFFQEVKKGRYEIVIMEDVMGRLLFTQLWNRLLKTLDPEAREPAKVLLVRHYKDPRRIRQKALHLKWQNVLIPPLRREKFKKLLLSLA